MRSGRDRGTRASLAQFPLSRSHRRSAHRQHRWCRGTAHLRSVQSLRRAHQRESSYLQDSASGRHLRHTIGRVQHPPRRRSRRRTALRTSGVARRTRIRAAAGDRGERISERRQGFGVARRFIQELFQPDLRGQVRGRTPIENACLSGPLDTAHKQQFDRRPNDADRPSRDRRNPGPGADRPLDCEAQAERPVIPNPMLFPCCLSWHGIELIPCRDGHDAAAHRQ